MLGCVRTVRDCVRLSVNVLGYVRTVRDCVWLSVKVFGCLRLSSLSLLQYPCHQQWCLLSYTAHGLADSIWHNLSAQSCSLPSQRKHVVRVAGSSSPHVYCCADNCASLHGARRPVLRACIGHRTTHACKLMLCVPCNLCSEEQRVATLCSFYQAWPLGHAPLIWHACLQVFAGQPGR